MYTTLISVLTLKPVQTISVLLNFTDSCNHTLGQYPIWWSLQPLDEPDWLTGQTFAGKTFDHCSQVSGAQRNSRTWWYHGKCPEECNYCVRTAILWCWWQARNGCVMPFTWNCKGHLIHRSVLVLFSIIWPIRNVLPHNWCSQNSGDVNKNLSIVTRCFPPVNVWPSRWYQWPRWLTFLHGEEEGAWVSSLLEQSGQARQKLEERWNYDKFC